jgi:Transglycosylase SLT domain
LTFKIAFTDLYLFDMYSKRLMKLSHCLRVPRLVIALNCHATQPLFSTMSERCIIPAAQFHHVNPLILRAILRVESALRPHTITRNANGTLDIGMGGMNSSNFRELLNHGISPEHLLDACVATYVAAWHLRKNLTLHGNTWFGVAAYHSTTPYFNSRYQILIYNELIKSGTLMGQLRTVPPLSATNG